MTTLEHPPTRAKTSAEAAAEPFGLLAEFATVDGVIAAAEAARAAGYRHFDVHSPFPIHGIDEVMGHRPTILPWVTLLAGVGGLVAGLGLTLGTMAYHYPYMISGKPFDSLPAFIPIVFELTILISGVTTGVFMLLLNKLPMLYNPLFKSERFSRATNDRFFLEIESRDRRFDKDQTRRFLEGQSALAVELVEK